MEPYNGALIADKDHFVYGMGGISLEVLTARAERRPIGRDAKFSLASRTEFLHLSGT